jgi:hypothetical protein
MALKMLCSHWLVCGWILSLLVGMAVAIFQRYAHPEWFTSLPWYLPALKKEHWEGGWACYAAIRGRMAVERIQIGRSHQRGITGVWQGDDRSGWNYA